MTRNPACSIYVGNLDFKVTERILYEVLIQAGPLVELYLPTDKETKKHKGFAFAEYETEENAAYAIKLFSGIVSLNKKILKFAMSGQDKAPQNNDSVMNTPPVPYPVNVNTLLSNSNITWRADYSLVNSKDSPLSHIFPQAYSNGLVYRGPYNGSAPASSSPGGFVNGLVNSNYEYDRRVFGSMVNNVSYQGPRNPIAYPSY